MITKSIAHATKSGGRKTAMARVQLVPGSGTSIVVNGKSASDYFQNNAVYLQNLVNASELVKTEAKYDAYVFVQGGGLSAQAQAIRLALSKAFVELFPDYRKSFKKPGFLTRDARIKERRKYGLKKLEKLHNFQNVKFFIFKVKLHFLTKTVFLSSCLQLVTHQKTMVDKKNILFISNFNKFLFFQRNGVCLIFCLLN